MTTFETPRLFLRPRSAGDFNPCLAMDREPQVIRYVGPPWSNDEEHVAFLRERIETVYPAGLGYWSIFPREDRSDFLGWVMLCPTAVAGAEVEIGWRLKRAAWGRGYAAEAAVPILAQGFARNAGLNMVVADIDPGNHASIRVAEKVRLRFAGIFDYGGAPAQRYSLTRAAFDQYMTG